MTTIQARSASGRHPSLARCPVAHPCPACGDETCEVFYTLRDIPSHSCLLMSTRNEALEFPRGDLELAWCPACGFIYNTAWNAELRQYSDRYEETQGFSPTFNAFARDLARRCADRYNLGDKTTLEIGCGKGEFLITLCQLSGGRGIGLDPSYIPSRIAGADTANVEFIRDYYGPRYAHLSADFIVCRHTLEHIAPVHQFLHDLRVTIGDRSCPVFFELPDVARVLAEGAFWDLYYEHCSYFTAGSLARLFRRTRFDVTHLSLEYDGQYIILDAVPSPGPTSHRLELENDAHRVKVLVDRFAATCGESLDRWRRFIDERVGAGERIVVWGSGSKGVAFLTTLGIEREIQYIVDINPHKHGKYMPGTGQEIVPPEFLMRFRPQHIIVMNPVYMREIAAHAQRLGIDAALTPV